MTVPTLFRGGLVFDGRNQAPVVSDLLVAGGRVAAIAPYLAAAAPGTRVVDCAGLWLMPGLLDIHTHLDLEVEIAPALPEVVRHGTTTVVMSNCSLGVAYGNQRRNGDDPIVDCFARVENVPKSVLARVADRCTWTDSAGYLEHFDRLSLGPNVVPLIPHSMLRIEVMGLAESVTRQPTAAELDRMERLVELGMEEGYAGFSTDGLPFHFLANRPNTRKQIPTQFASFRELRRLTDVVRRYDRVWQATPPKDSPWQTVRNFLLTSGRLFGRPLKLTATAAIDLFTNGSIAKAGLALSSLLNSWLVGGEFRFQALSAPFRIWSDGVITPVAEEIPVLRRLNELEWDDRAGRTALLNDPVWVAAFRKMWLEGKRGFNLSNLLRLLRRESNVLNRRLDDMVVADCPLHSWKGQALEAPYQRLRAWQASQGRSGATDAEEEAFFAGFPQPIADDAAFFLHLLRSWDTDLRWETVVANRDPAVLEELLFHPQTLPGFNDSGAHLTNLAFYDGNLRTLKIAQKHGPERVATAVHRLTQLPAQFFGLNAGVLEVGAQADLCVVDPKALRQWNPEATYELVRREAFGCNQVVNRPQGVVRHVMIGGATAWQDGQYVAEFGRERFGRLLRNKDHPREIDSRRGGGRA